MTKRLGLIWIAYMLGWWYPIRAVSTTWWRRIPIERKHSFEWARLLTRLFRVKLERDEGALPLTGRRCLFLGPHRCFADLFLHKMVTDGRAAILSRAMMGIVFPLTWLCTRPDRSVWFFNRKKRRGRHEFYRWLDREFERCPLESLIVYPEGHRHRGDDPLPLMRGLLNYAFSRQIPCQVFGTERNERVFNESARTWSRGETVRYRFEPVLDPVDFPSRHAFIDAANEAFERCYREVVVPGR